MKHTRESQASLEKAPVLKQVKALNKYIALIVILFNSQVTKSANIDENYKATCAGIEVIGVDSKTAQRLRERMPLQEGDSYIVSDNEKYRPVCIERVKEIIPQSEPSCTFLIYGDATVYMIVDVFTKGDRIASFRKIPEKNGKITKLPAALKDLYEKWEDRRSALISNGSFPIENYDKGYIDYEDPVLHALALQLTKLSGKHNQILLDIVHYSNDAEERSMAATLFSWSRHPENLSLILKWNILLDPDKGVRNDIARAFGVFLGQMQDKTVLKSLLPTYCKLAMFPGHTDRNKALSSIKRIITAHPELAFEIDSECKRTIFYMSETSILDNVGGTAKEILKIMRNTDCIAPFTLREFIDSPSNV